MSNSLPRCTLTRFGRSLYSASARHRNQHLIQLVVTSSMVTYFRLRTHTRTRVDAKRTVERRLGQSIFEWTCVIILTAQLIFNSIAIRKNYRSHSHLAQPTDRSPGNSTRAVKQLGWQTFWVMFGIAGNAHAVIYQPLPYLLT